MAPIIDSAYTDVDMQIALYNNPSDEVLLTEYLLQTGGVQLGIASSNLGASNPPFDAGQGGGGGGGGGGGSCFTGETLYTLFNGVQIPMAELYENRKQYIGKGCRAFTQDKEQIIVPGEIRDVTKRTLYELLHVGFEDEPGEMRMAPQHRFWMRNHRFKPMFQIQRPWPMQTYDGEAWGTVRFERRMLVQYPEGVDVYNTVVGIYHDYFATQPGGVPKAVSNVKPLGEP